MQVVIIKEEESNNNNNKITIWLFIASNASKLTPHFDLDKDIFDCWATLCAGHYEKIGHKWHILYDRL